MPAIVAIAVTAVLSYGIVEFALSFCRDNCWTSLVIWGFAIATGAIIPYVVIDAMVSMVRGDKEVI